jgi:hypothetical protein
MVGRGQRATVARGYWTFPIPVISGLAIYPAVNSRSVGM